jgi:phosphopantetheinyl transferase (holo-ACP synthase)
MKKLDAFVRRVFTSAEQNEAKTRPIPSRYYAIAFAIATD